MGNCPKCGRPVYENKKGFGCSGWKPGGKGCDFVIWKYDKAAKKKTTAEEARQILAEEARRNQTAQAEEARRHQGAQAGKDPQAGEDPES